MRRIANESMAIHQAEAGALFYVSHSGGKDSQASYLAVHHMLADLGRLDQLVVVHADLGEVEWHGTQDHIRATTWHPVNVVQAIYKDGSTKTLLDMVEKRAVSRPDVPAWPSSAQRYCTSDLKRGPIEKFIRNDMKARGATLAFNVMGLRAEESSGRAKKVTFTNNARLSKAGRQVYDWLPVHAWSVDDVFATIADAGQDPHYAYSLGNDRLSCVFCIFGSAGDLANGAAQRPELAAKYIELEQRTGNTLFHKAALSDRIQLKEIS